MQACLAGQALLFPAGAWVVAPAPPREADLGFSPLFIFLRGFPYNRGVRSLEDCPLPCLN